ncbi:hypothetical protein ACXR0O_20500 [Verrucomicrobiota bacterium sgz303538]
MRTVLLLFCSLIALTVGLPASEQVETEPRPLGLTKFDRRIIDAHKQLFPLSCIPSAAEMVLKLLGRVPDSYRDLQLAWQNKSDGCFRDFHNKTFAGVTFKYTAGPTDKLLEAIHSELHAGRFVVVGLRNPGGWHSWVIYDEDVSGEFLAVSKDRGRTIEERHVKKAILQSGGTDLGTYDFPTSLLRLPSSPPRAGLPSFTQ